MDSTGTKAQSHRRDVLALVALVVFVVGFLLPLVLQWWPSVFDDTPILELPGLIATARVFQSGSIPLWDFCTFAGAKPTYVDNAYLIFYPPMYPFFFLADTEDLRQSHAMLMLFPFMLHLVWAALGGYAFGRIVLHLHPWAAFLVGCLYALSPDMGFQLVSTEIAVTLSYLPWCTLVLARLMETGRLRWWIIGTLLLALTSSAGNPNYLIRVYFVLSVLTVLLWILLVWQSPREGSIRQLDAEPKPRWFVVRFLAAVSMFALSIGLTGFAWAGTLESITWLDEAISTMYSQYSSMFPLSIVTLFIPGFFGDLDARHTWGVGRLLSNHSTLSGGMFVMVAATGAILISFRPLDDSEKTKTFQRWTRISAFFLVCSLLTMMGTYTIAYRMLCFVAPWFFQVPHPVYYRFACCWSLAILAGLGISTLLTTSAERNDDKTWVSAVYLCVAAAMIGGCIGLVWGDDGHWSGPSSYTSLSSQGLWGWFLSRPIAYFTLASLVLVAGFQSRLFRRHGQWVCFGMFVEIVAIAWCIFYSTSHLGIQHPDEGRIDRHDTAYDYPGLSILLPLMDELVGERRFRCVGSDSRFDNTAWYFGGRSLMGYSAKPLMPWYAKALERFTSGKQALQMTDYPEQFLQNLNVRYQIVLTSDDEGLFNRMPAKPAKGAGTLVQQQGPFQVREVAEPLPYAYTQDQIVPLKLEEQLDKLFTTDLRRGVYVDPRFRNRFPSSETTDFEALQRVNMIELIDQTQGNRTFVQARISNPSMLIINECWHPGWKASIDGQPAQVYRVNYLQQGVWLEAGSQEVELKFFPSSLYYGIIASLLSAFIFAAVIAASRKLQRFRRD